jgi:hypothetical protein
VSSDETWDATVVKKSRAPLDGSNLYRRLTVRRADGQEDTIRVSRELWKSVEVGDRLVKAAGLEPRRA